MDHIDLGAWDRDLIRASQRGENVDFTTSLSTYRSGYGPEPIINADLFRILYTERWAGTGSDWQPQKRVRGWVVKGATFDRLIDLSDASPTGSLPSLSFEDCTFHNGFCADATVIQQLHFHRCCFGTFSDQGSHETSVSLHNTRIEGDLVLHGTSSTRKDRCLTIQASGLRTLGGLCISETYLKAFPDQRIAGVEYRCALDLSNSQIHSDLRLQPHNTIEGGLRLRNSVVGGDVRLCDLTVSDGYISPIGEYSQNSGQRDHAKAIHELNLKGTIPRDAIDASNLTVSGNLYLRKEPELERFRSFGRIGFFGLETRGAVILTGASLRAPYPQTFALILAGGKIGGDLISDFPGQLNDPQLRIWGGASFAELIVGRGVQLCGTFTNLDAPGLSVARDTTLSIRVESFLNLSGADLKGDLNLYGFHFFSFDPKTKPQFGFSMRAADVGHAIFLSQFIDTSYVSFKRCKRYKPLCYPQHELFQVETPMGWASILQKSGSPPLLLDGRSDPLHELNASGAVYLESDEAVADYIRFFGSYVWGEEGPFVIVEEKLQLPKDAVAKGICSVSAMVVSNEPSDIDLDQMRRLLAEDSHAVLDDQVWSNLKEQLRLHGRTARSNVRYGAYLSTATLFLLTAPIEEPLFGSQKRGMMFMLSDETIAEFKADKLPVYDRFLTRNQPQPDYPYQDLHPEDFSEVELTLRIPQWKRMLELKVAGFQNASVDLTNASCRTLEDADGLAWGTELSQIELENFRYASLGSSLMQTQTTTLGFTAKVLLLFLGRKDRIPQRCLTLPRLFVQRKRRSSKDRIDWLRRMPHQGNVFRPQPYAHLASVLNSSGDYVVANRVEEERINLEVRHESIRLRSKAPLFLTYLFYRPLWAVFHVAYRYGLSPARATAVLFLCLLGGWKGVDVLNQHDLLVQNTSSVSTLVTKDKNKLVTAFPLPANGQKYESQDLLCGTSINEFLYAADVFIPLLDLRQEGRCDVRSVREGEIRPIQEWKIQAKTGHKITHFLWALFHDGVLWAQLLKSAYAVLGWVVISLTILTYSGTLRRWGEK